MQGHPDHQIHERRDALTHAQGDAFEDRVDAEGQQKDKGRDVDTTDEDLLL